MSKFKVFYNAGTRQIYIDDYARSTTLDVPSDLTDAQAQDYIHSDAMHAIIDQLDREGDV